MMIIKELLKNNNFRQAFLLAWKRWQNEYFEGKLDIDYDKFIIIDEFMKFYDSTIETLLANKIVNLDNLNENNIPKILLEEFEKINLDNIEIN